MNKHKHDEMYKKIAQHVAKLNIIFNTDFDEYKKIAQHGAKLNIIFNTDFDDLTLSEKLRRLEVKAHHATTMYCDGKIAQDEMETIEFKIIKSVRKILNVEKKCNEISIFLNYDARGYALKIKSEDAKNLDIDKDFGGFGILAPDFNL